jgi:hypothetical protein
LSNIPYIRDRDFARIRELVQTIEELTKKEGHLSIPNIASRAIMILDKYIAEDLENKKRD